MLRSLIFLWGQVILGIWHEPKYHYIAKLTQDLLQYQNNLFQGTDFYYFLKIIKKIYYSTICGLVLEFCFYSDFKYIFVLFINFFCGIENHRKSLKSPKFNSYARTLRRTLCSAFRKRATIYFPLPFVPLSTTLCCNRMFFLVSLRRPLSSATTTAASGII